MTSKELNQIDEILSGTSRYKFLDPTRKVQTLDDLLDV